MKNRLKKKAGFTLVELMMSMVISVMVFFAMGNLLVKALRLWGEGFGQWHIANQARTTRARILSGGMGPGSGLLSISEIKSIQTNPNWCTLEYQVAALPEKFWIQGSVDNTAPADKSVFIKDSKGGGQTWLMMVGTKRGSHDIPDVMASTCVMAYSNQTLSVSYTLSYEACGKTFEYPQFVQAYLVNL
jgi:prepilin-type N-terminal cleavage/methylation domain-containing protein